LHNLFRLEVREAYVLNEFSHNNFIKALN